MLVFVILALAVIAFVAIASFVEQTDSRRIEASKEIETYSNRFHQDD